MKTIDPASLVLTRLCDDRQALDARWAALSSVIGVMARCLSITMARSPITQHAAFAGCCVCYLPDTHLARSL